VTTSVFAHHLGEQAILTYLAAGGIGLTSGRLIFGQLSAFAWRRSHQKGRRERSRSRAGTDGRGEEFGPR
jgi:hypothetical protein